MNTQSQPVSNAHLTANIIHDRQADKSAQISYFNQYNVALTRERNLARYRTAFSDRTNIWDNARTVEPQNVFGHRFIHDIDRRQKIFPAGMDMTNSRQQTGAAFTQQFKRFYPQNL
jgi:hypothetical protein